MSSTTVRFARAIGFAACLSLTRPLVAIGEQALSAGAVREHASEDKQTETHTYHVLNSFFTNGLHTSDDGSYSAFTFAQKYSAFSIAALLPDFTPAGNNLDEYKRLGWHSQIHVLVEHNAPPLINKSDYILNLLYFGNLSENDFHLVDGCKVYEGHMAGISELHVCTLPDRLFIFSCLHQGEMGAVRPYCHVVDDLRDGDRVTYSYSRDFMHSAVEIDGKVRNLLNSFRVAGEH